MERNIDKSRAGNFKLGDVVVLSIDGSDDFFGDLPWGEFDPSGEFHGGIALIMTEFIIGAAGDFGRDGDPLFG